MYDFHIFLYFSIDVYPHFLMFTCPWKTCVCYELYLYRNCPWSKCAKLHPSMINCFCYRTSGKQIFHGLFQKNVMNYSFYEQNLSFSVKAWGVRFAFLMLMNDAAFVIENVIFANCTVTLALVFTLNLFCYSISQFNVQISVFSY